MRLRVALAVATALGIGLLVLQRWVAETRTAAMILVAAWFAVVGIGILFAVKRERAVALATFGAIALATAAIGYWTGFRDRTVDEMVVVATRDASPVERDAALAGEPVQAEEQKEKPSGPVRVLRGEIAGADGHVATGEVAVVREPDGTRRLTLTDFDADPGPQVEVHLSPSEEKTDDTVKLGALKGNVGDQQYKIPDSADLGRYDTLILWCVPFTTRIAVAPLA